MSSGKSESSLKSQGAWLLIAKTIGFAFAFALPMLVVRILDKNEYGVYQQAFRILVTAVGILPIGMTMSAYYYLSREKDKRAAAALNILVFNFVVGGLTFAYFCFFPQVIGDKLMTSHQITELAPLIGFAIWVWLFAMFLEVIAVANKEPRISTIFIIFSQMSKSVFMLSAILIFGTVRALLWGAILQGILQTIILLRFINKRFPGFWKAFNLRFMKEQMYYAIPLGLAGMLWMLQTQAHYYFVSYRFSDAEYAIYEVGCFQLPLVSILAESVGSIMIPKMSELQLTKDTREMLRITFRAMQSLAVMIFPIYIFLFVNAEVFVGTLFTKNYLSSVPILRVFLTLLPFHVLNSDPLFRVFDKFGKYLVMFRALSGITLLIWLSYGIQHYGLVGIITIVVAVRIGEMVIAETFVFSKIGVTRADLQALVPVIKTAIAAILAGIPMYALSLVINEPVVNFTSNMIRTFTPGLKQSYVYFISGSTVLGILLVVFSVVYVPAIYMLSAINDSDKRMISRFLNRARARFSGGLGSTA